MCKCIKCEECLERQKKYYNDNKEDIIKKSKEYYNNHKDEIKENRKEYMKEYIKVYRSRNKDVINEELNKKIECECGGRYTRRNKSTHMKSKKHTNYVNIK